jgi:hypothetical protein
MQQLSFVPSSVLQHMIDSGIINAKSEAKALIQLILAPIEFSNSTLIHNEKVLINAFISSVSFSDSKIYDITVVEPAIEVTSSNSAFKNIEFKSISNPSNYNFIFVLLESSLSFEASSMKDSNSTLFVTRSSEVNIDGLVF